MFRLSEKLARLEDCIWGRWGKKLERFFDRRKVQFTRDYTG